MRVRQEGEKVKHWLSSPRSEARTIRAYPSKFILSERMGIVFPNNRHHMFAAADLCLEKGKPVDAITRLLTKEEADSAFAAWESERGKTGVTMRLTRSASEAYLVAHFEPPA